MHIGKNIELKPIAEEDYPLLHNWFNQPDFTGNFFNIWCLSMGTVTKMLNTPPSQEVYLIVDRASIKPAGALFSFHPYTESSYQGQEIGYIVHQDSRGKGLATQASSMLINHIFDSTQIERIIASVVVGNVGSCRVLEKAGMKLEGVERKKFFLHGVFRDMRLYSIIREEWVDEPTYKLHHPF